ncbi:unnamed protein product [Adineta ricciae]|uniref:Uncharacterized protein n=1 Tax=Adineta ricciae TaxID=249248 RepID=A0A814ZZV4_ADIRI|nr:unnamed protein product [Adineta ricciae]CAF1522238.1 unnamed protein product [Adineta ricciae]
MVGTIKDAQIVTNAPSDWLMNQYTWSQCLCYSLANSSIVALNFYTLNSTCQLFTNVSSYPFQIVKNSNVTTYLLKQLTRYAPCCSNISWLMTQIQSAAKTLSMPSITSLALDSINQRLGVVASAVLRSVSLDSFALLNVSVGLAANSQTISYSQGLFYTGVYPVTAPFAFTIYSGQNFSKIGSMNFTGGGPQRIIWLFNDTLVCVLLQTNPSTISKANFYNWPSGTLVQSITLSITNAYGLGKAPNNDTFVYITDGSTGGDVWQLRTSAPYNFTLFALTTNATETPASVTVDGCNRVWVVYAKFGVRIYDLNSRALLMSWKLFPTYPLLYDLVLSDQYQLYLADYSTGKLARYGSGIQCTA